MATKPKADKDKVPYKDRLPSAEELIKLHGTKSAAIRILASKDVPVADIARHMGIKYQHARNVLVRPLKRQLRRK